MFDVWKNVLAEIEQVLPQSTFNTWFPDVNITSISNGVVTIEVPNIFKQRQIQKKYDNIIKDALIHNSVEFSDVKYIISSRTTVKPHSREVSMETIKKKTLERLSNSTTSGNNHTYDSGLNPNYTMSNFVVASNNDLAVSVAWAIIKEPGTKYNPFFVYGGPGLGKTHLVQAIGNELLHNNPKLKVLYTPMNHFYSEFINSIKNRNKSKNYDSEDFIKKYHKVDVLIIDDFQMIIGKDASQTQFFNIFNDLYQQGRQVIITCDRMPSQLKELDARLTSRLSWAGAYDIQMPNFEDKCAILRAKADYENIEIEDEAIEYIANNIKTNIRDLEGEFRKILAYADFKKTTPLGVINGGFINTPSNANNSLLSPKKIVNQVAQFYELSVDEMCGKSRVSHIKNARQVAMYLLSEELSLSTTKIALEVGVKDHTTVMHGVKKIRNDLKINFVLRDQVSAIREKLYE
ncbi:chromosomal replication initiator protein DnaA [Candidatus Saccharibacteria bacterium]|nr:chromosomal replication initiator protein DnaA [Candidatus Saccharibacteria bacterium]MBR3233817.1 chromosomal replication initiator protein DnaA [Candidatus Saccharibacteria bacterium]